MPRRLATSLLLLMPLVLGTGPAHAHALPDHSNPAVGSELQVSPTSVRIWFDDQLKDRHSKLYVTDSNGRRVSDGPARLDKSDPKLLEVNIPKLEPGTYHVYWIAVSRDGHRTRGDYLFTVTGSQVKSP